MQQQDVVLEVKNVSKGFLLSEALRTNLKEVVTGFFKSDKTANAFQALQHISFELNKGEVLGIIGKNGAGKSTLLKILSGITLPDEGEINFYGRPVSILDVGAGFHPELSGVENIIMVGQLYGISRSEMQAKVEEIVRVSGIGKFAYEPVKNYSSGMYVRLAFSLVIGLDADIMIFDEVLGVGDADFQLTVMEHIKRMIEKKHSIIIVTHNPRDIVNLCDKVIEIEGGKIKAAGGTEVLQSYLDATVDNHVSLKQIYNEVSFDNPLQGSIVQRVYIEQQGSQAMYGDMPIEVLMDVNNTTGEDLSLALRITDIRGNALLSTGSDISNSGNMPITGGAGTVVCTIPANLFSHGTYLLSVFVLKGGEQLVERHKSILQFSVGRNRSFPDTTLYNGSQTSLVIPFAWGYKNAP